MQVCQSVCTYLMVNLRIHLYHTSKHIVLRYSIEKGYECIASRPMRVVAALCKKDMLP